MNQIPDGGIDDDESAATEVAEAPAGEGDDEWTAIIENLWNEYDADNSGFLDKEEMMPLAKAALAQIGYS